MIMRMRPSTAPCLRPILFSPAMVRALLSGRKTQTRRAIVPQPVLGPVDHGERIPKPEVAPFRCRYGIPGDGLWVRERWGYRRQFNRKSARPAGPVVYAADESSAHLPLGAWRSSLHMPRRLSRIQLLITDVRMQRLQSISETDAPAEGFDPDGEMADPLQWFHRLWDALHPRGDLAWCCNPWVWVIVFERLRVVGGGNHE
jgi:hypothetical protein